MRVERNESDLFSRLIVAVVGIDICVPLFPVVRLVSLIDSQKPLRNPQQEKIFDNLAQKARHDDRKHPLLYLSDTRTLRHPTGSSTYDI